MYASLDGDIFRMANVVSVFVVELGQRLEIITHIKKMLEECR